MKGETELEQVRRFADQRAEAIERLNKSIDSLVASNAELLRVCKDVIKAAEAHDDAPPGNCLAEWGAMRDAIHAAKQVISKAEGKGEA